MDKVIFLFDTEDVYYLLEEAVERLQERRSTGHTKHELVQCWFRSCLKRDMHLALLESGVDSLQSLLDMDFQRDTFEHAERLYRQLNIVVYHKAHPCLEDWCAVTLNRFNLILTFTVGPIDYGARLA